MILKFKEIKIENFMSFSNATVKLEDCGFTLVSGINQNEKDLSKSNGSGKSSLWESIIWCLTGETIRGTKDIKNKVLEGTAKVDLLLEVDEDTFNIIREKEQDSTKLRLIVNGEDKSGKGIRDTEKILKEFLPDLTISLLGSVVILGQGLPQKFTGNKPSERKELLETLSKSDFMITDIKEKITNRKAILDKSIREIEDNILMYNTNIKLYTSQLDENESKLKSLENAEAMEESLNGKNIKLKEMTENFTQLDSKIICLRDKIKGISEEISNNQNKMTEEVLEIEHKYNREINDKNNLKLAVEINIKNTNSKIEEIKNIKDICPTCGQKINCEIDRDTTQLEKDIKDLQEDLSAIQCQLATINKSLTNDMENCKKCYGDKISPLKMQYDSIKEQGIALSSEKEQLNNDITSLRIEITDISNKLSNHTELKKSLLDSINNLKLKITQLNNSIEFETNKEIELKERLQIITKMSTIAGRDFRGVLLEDIIHYLDEKSKKFGEIVFGHTNIGIELDGNNIEINYNDKAYENLSGGERQKVDVIIQFSIREMLVNLLNFNSNILVLDEIFDNLDSVGCQKVLELITTELLDIESVFIITHHSDIDIPYDNELKVIKNNEGISNVY